MDRMRRGPVTEVFRVFFLLGLTSFGGPVAHIGFFRTEFVEKRRWLTDAAYADLVALCQFMPGPASSQVGMALGLMRAGLVGMVAAWIGFTAPSALLMVGLAYGAGWLEAVAGGGWIMGLKAAAVAVVAHALYGMARALAPDRERGSVAAAGLILAALLPGFAGQGLAIVLGAVVGALWLRADREAAGAGFGVAVSKRIAVGALALFGFGLIFALLTGFDGPAGLFSGFYRIGALVFGGGHVVLPLIEADMVESGLVSRDAFLAGYGAVQAAPGPLFTISGYLGAVAGGLGGALLALIGIFLPSMLLTVGALPFWAMMRRAIMARKMLAGVNAAVVGLLAAAFYDPVLSAGIGSPEALAIAAAGFVALALWRVPVWLVVIAAGMLGGVIL